MTGVPAYGIDVSSWQHPHGAAINWSQIAKGKQFVYIKCTESNDYSNPYFTHDIRGASEVGMFVGCYHFADFTQSARDQATYFLDIAQQAAPSQGGLMPPMLDIEEACFRENIVSDLEIQDWIGSFLEVITSQTHRKTVLYTSSGFWSRHVGSSGKFADMPLNLAYWPDDQNIPHPDVDLPGAWRDWTFWQYASDGNVDGIAGSGQVDLIRYNPRFGPIEHSLTDWL